MDAHAALDEHRRQTPVAHPLGMLAPAALWLLMVLLIAAGLLLCARRLSGALLAPPPPSALWGLGFVLACASLLLRRLAISRSASRRCSIAAWVLPPFVLLLVLAGVALPGTSAVGLAALVGLVLLEEGWSWGRSSAFTNAVAEPRLAAVEVEAEPPGGEAHVASEAAAMSSEEPPLEDLAILEMPAAERLFRLAAVEDEVARPFAQEREYDHSDDSECAGACGDACLEDVTQQIVRRRVAGGEVLEGFARVDFASGERVGAAHVAICPPLTRVPTCYAEPSDGPDSQVRITHTYTHGVRLEVKLDQPAEDPTVVLVEFSIQEHPEALSEEAS